MALTWAFAARLHRQPQLARVSSKLVRITTDSVDSAFVTSFDDTRAAAVPVTADNMAACR